MSKWTNDPTTQFTAAETLKAAATRIQLGTNNYHFVNNEAGIFIGVFIPKTVAGPEADAVLSQHIDDWKQIAGTYPVPQSADTKAITDADEEAIQDAPSVSQSPAGPVASESDPMVSDEQAAATSGGSESV